MTRPAKSILQELRDINLSRDPTLLIESRGSNIIESAINLINLMKQQFSEEQASELERRFINSIKGADSNKFKRGVRRIREGKPKS